MDSRKQAYTPFLTRQCNRQSSANVKPFLPYWQLPETNRARKAYSPDRQTPNPIKHVIDRHAAWISIAVIMQLRRSLRNSV